MYCQIYSYINITLIYIDKLGSHLPWRVKALIRARFISVEGLEIPFTVGV